MSHITLKPTHRLLLVLIVLALLGVAALAVSAQDGSAANPTPVRQVTDDEVNAIAHKLYCPVCENITLDTCGTAACADWRYEIRLQLESGSTEEQIVDDFVRRFGDRVVGTPIDPTLRALSLYTPWIVVAGVVIGGVIIFAQRGRFAPATPVAKESTDRFQELFEQDVAGS